MAGRQSEGDIRDLILEYLQRRGIFVWRDKQTVTRNHRGVHFPESKGCPDIIGITKGGKFLGIEIKKPKGVLSIEQHNFLERIRENGGIGIVATQLEDVVVKFKQIGG